MPSHQISPSPTGKKKTQKKRSSQSPRTTSQELKTKEPRQIRSENHWPSSISSPTTLRTRGPMPRQMGLPLQQPETEVECTFPPGKRRSSPSSRTTSQELKTRNPDRPGAEITDPRGNPVQLPSEQGDPCLDRWACHCSSQRRRLSVHQVQRRGIKPLVSNWKVLNKLQSGGRGLESSSNKKLRTTCR